MRFRANMACVVVALAFVIRVPADETLAATNSVNRVRQVEACIEKIDAMLAYLTQLEQATTNSDVRQKCIEMQRAKLIGLSDLAHNAQARFADTKPEDDAFELIATQISSVTERAEKVVADLEFCNRTFKAIKDSKPAKSKTVVSSSPPVSRSTNVVAKIFVYPLPRPYVSRNEHECLTQSRLACLLAKVFGLGEGRVASASMKALAAKGIEPLDGWKLDKTANLDDFCVAIGRALKVHVAAESEAVCYYEALRQAGFPIDICFPGCSSNHEPPFLLETEVKEFLATGIGGPPSM